MTKPRHPVEALIRLLDNDPEGWKIQSDLCCRLIHRSKVRVDVDSYFSMSVVRPTLRLGILKWRWRLWKAVLRWKTWYLTHTLLLSLDENVLYLPEKIESNSYEA